MRVIFAMLLGAAASPAWACSDMEIWDYFMSMCMPLPMPGMPMKMAMLQGQAFFTQTFEEKPRGRSAFSIPNMFMADVGSSVGEHHYFNLEFMGTVEKWTFPRAGTPELLQVGEHQADGSPFFDAQHPHSSPIMGLTLSDTIAFDHAKDYAKLWFAPRGEAGDGPIAFMHRPTGRINPDAPLGHHIGQDVGHISSTVIGGSLQLARTTVALSTFHGTEPSPTRVDLPLGSPNSYAFRLTQAWTQSLFAMASAAYVKNPEWEFESRLWRYSASIYSEAQWPRGWTLHHALIWGLINGYNETSALNSFTEEFWLHKEACAFWGRVEELQRTPEELQIADITPVHKGKWVTAVTIGYVHKIVSEIGLGGSITKDFLPTEMQRPYGGNPLTAKIFVRVSTEKMWEL